MGLDRVPGDDNLFIGGMLSLRRRAALQDANITHVLSILRMSPDEALFGRYDHLLVEVDDLESENLLEHFTATNAFIHKGLSGGGGVLVHCAMGKSRSTTCVMAYLMQKYHLTPHVALARVRQCRPLCEPNNGFMKQLELYHRVDCTSNIDENPQYQRWLYQCEVERSIACGKAPDQVRFEDEQRSSSTALGGSVELRCRKCRRALATDQFFVGHSAGETEGQGREPRACAHYFVEPLSWMRSELEHGRLAGKLECPKCTATVGKYAWQGMRCSCGRWVVPCISLAKGKVDEVGWRPQQHTTGSSDGRSSPPIRPVAQTAPREDACETEIRASLA